MIYRGHQVSLGPLDRKHLETIRGWRNNPKIWAWSRQYDPITDAGQEAWYDRLTKDASTKLYMIHDKDNRPVGVCGFSSIDWVNRRAEFSIYVAPEWHGNGLGRLALETLVAHGFKMMGLNCIWGETFEGNPAANVFEAVGFKREGTRREFYFREGRFLDAHLYSLLRVEWDRLLQPRVPAGTAIVVAETAGAIAYAGAATEHPARTVFIQKAAGKKKADRSRRLARVPKRA